MIKNAALPNVGPTPMPTSVRLARRATKRTSAFCHESYAFSIDGHSRVTYKSVKDPSLQDVLVFGCEGFQKIMPIKFEWYLLWSENWLILVEVEGTLCGVGRGKTRARKAG